MDLRYAVTAFLIPAGVFQSVIVGGGYGTGREVVQFVTRHGGPGGYLATCVIAAGFALVLALSFALAHRWQAWDYRHFLKRLLGPAWVVYEGLFVALLVLVLAIVGAAAGELVLELLRVPYATGVAATFAVVVALNYFGRRMVERCLFGWSVLVMVALAVLVASVAVHGGPRIAAGYAEPPVFHGAALDGFRFAVYNSALVPVLLYCVKPLRSERHALLSGTIAGLAGALPAAALHTAFLAHYPGIVDAALPTYELVLAADARAAVLVYVVVLLGTIMLTAAGVLQGVNTRLDGWRADLGRAPLPAAGHAAVAGAVLAASLALARFGIVDLVAQGYGTLAWGFFAVFTLPLVTLGAWRLARPLRTAAQGASIP